MTTVTTERPFPNRFVDTEMVDGRRVIVRAADRTPLAPPVPPEEPVETPKTASSRRTKKPTHLRRSDAAAMYRHSTMASEVKERRTAPREPRTLPPVPTHPECREVYLLRVGLGLSQKAAAQIANMAQASVSRAERQPRATEVRAHLVRVLTEYRDRQGVDKG